MASSPQLERFDAWMQRALFDPQRGYYSRRIQDVGARGDFSTSATLSPLLGKAIARWLKAAQGLMPEVKAVIEVGAGNGSLMKVVQQQVGWWSRWKTDWHIVETSPALQEKQKAVLGEGRVQWWTDLPSALQAAGGKAFIFHNELLDAFPCRRLRWDGSAWQEIWLATEAGKNTPTEQRRLFDGSFTRTAAFDWPQVMDGQHIEVHESVFHWLQDWTRHWQRGEMLTIDYGDLFPQVYHRQPHGTLRAYFLHQRHVGPEIYANMGRQDLTADINFTDYRDWCQFFGLEEMAYSNMADLIRQYGLKADTETDRFLMDESGSGSAFKVLRHRR